MGDLGLFTGIETQNYSFQQIDTVISFLHTHGIPQWVLKVYEITQGDWYGHLGGSRAVVNHIQNQGIHVVPYGFFYGNNTSVEGTAVNGYLDTFGVFCMDMESDFDGPGNQHKCQELAKMLHSGHDLRISTWANPEAHGWIPNIQVLDPLVSTWMPMAYDNTLVKDMYAQYPKVRGTIQPTFHINQTSPVMAQPFQTFTLWEYQMALSNGGAFQQYSDVWKRSNQQMTGIEQQALDTWNASPLKLPTGSGIYNVWRSAYLAKSFNFGYPTTPEFDSVNWDNLPIRVQYFSSGARAEFNNADTFNKCKFYDVHNTEVYQG